MTNDQQLCPHCDPNTTDETVPKGYVISERGDDITGYCWHIPGFVDAGAWWPTRALAAADARRHARILAERAKGRERVRAAADGLAERATRHETAPSVGVEAALKLRARIRKSWGVWEHTLGYTIDFAAGTYISSPDAAIIHPLDHQWAVIDGRLCYDGKPRDGWARARARIVAETPTATPPGPPPTPGVTEQRVREIVAEAVEAVADAVGGPAHTLAVALSAVLREEQRK